MNKKFSIKNSLNSFKYAFNGLLIFFKSQQNAWIHLAFAIGVGILGIYFKITFYEWIAICGAVGLVFTAEIINTAIEFLTDLVSPHHNIQAGKVKDLAAGAVLVASISALLIAVFVFIPKLIV